MVENSRSLTVYLKWRVEMAKFTFIYLFIYFYLFIYSFIYVFIYLLIYLFTYFLPVCLSWKVEMTRCICYQLTEAAELRWPGFLTSILKLKGREDQVFCCQLNEAIGLRWPGFCYLYIEAESSKWPDDLALLPVYWS